MNVSYLKWPTARGSEFFKPVKKSFCDFEVAFGEAGKIRACVKFVCGLPEVTSAVIGVTTTSELEEILASKQDSMQLDKDCSSFAVENAFYLHPGNWGELTSLVP